MEELEFNVEIQGWHPELFYDYSIMHAYLKPKNTTKVVYMLSVKLFEDDYEVVNSYISDRYKELEGHMLDDVLRRMKLI